MWVCASGSSTVSYVANLLASEPGTKAGASRGAKVEKYRERSSPRCRPKCDEISQGLAGDSACLKTVPYPRRRPRQAEARRRSTRSRPTDKARRPGCRADGRARQLPETATVAPRSRIEPTRPFFNSVFDAAPVVRRHRPRPDDARHQARRAARPARAPRRQRRQARRPRPARVPRRPGKGDPAFHHGSGRLELAETIFTDAAPLAARVIVNRVWGWHFGKPLVDTPSDFGAQGEKPTHPATARRPGRALHRQRLVAQVAAPRDHALRRLPAGQPAARRRREDRPGQSPALADEPAPPRHRGLSRLHPASRPAALDATLGRPVRRTSTRPATTRRTVYAPRQPRPAQQRCCSSTTFPKPTMHSPGRETDHHAAAAAVRHEQPVHARPGRRAGRKRRRRSPTPTRRSAACTARCCARDPDEPTNSRSAPTISASGTLAEYAHALLSHQRGDLLAMNQTAFATRRCCSRLGGGLGIGRPRAILLARQTRGGRAAHYAGPHFAPQAKHNIVLFMPGGPSQVDMFDPKPALHEVRRPASRFRQPAHRAHHRRPAALAVRVHEARPSRPRDQRAAAPTSPPSPTTSASSARCTRSTRRTRRRAACFTPATSPPRARRWARGSPTAWAPKTRTCPASSS